MRREGAKARKRKWKSGFASTLAPTSSGLLWVAAIGATLLVGWDAVAGYRDLSREIEAYEPPAVYRSRIKESPGAEIPAVRTDPAFEAEKARLRERQKAWEDALSAPAAEASFLVPDPARVERLKSAATEAGAAERALADGFSLEDLEALALLRSPAVQAKERETRAALEAYSQVANLDEILRQYTAFTASLMTGVGNMESTEAMAVKFPFPGILALKGEVAGQEVKAAWEELEAARRQAVTSARKAYWELFYTRRARETMGQMVNLLDHLKAATSARYAAGETNFQDVIKVGIEREKLKEELTTMAEMQRNMEAEIREILNLPPSTAVGAPAPRDPTAPTPDLESLYPKALERRQELRRMKAMIGKMERMIEMAETMVYPGFALNLSLYEKDDVSRVGGGGGMAEGKATFPTATSASMGEGLPKMPWYGANDAYLRETRQRLEALRKELQMEEASTLLRVRGAWFRLDKARREDDLFGQRVVALSQAALEASSRGYSAGKVMFADVIEAYTGWLEANLARERRRADVGVGWAELADAVGTREIP